MLSPYKPFLCLVVHVQDDQSVNMGSTAYVNDPAKDSIAAAWAAPSVSACPQHLHQTRSDRHQTAAEAIVEGTADSTESKSQASTSQPDSVGVESRKQESAPVVVAATKAKDFTADNAMLLLAQELEVAKEQNQGHEEKARYISYFDISIDICHSKPATRSCVYVYVVGSCKSHCDSIGVRTQPLKKLR